MADDVVERLREEARFGWNLAANRQRDTRELHTEAADEIERLRAELARRSPSPDAEAARREAIEAARRIVGRDARYEDEWLNGAAVTVARAFLALSPPVEGE